MYTSTPNILTPKDDWGINYLVGMVIVEALRRLNIVDFVISPGARSAPLIMAVQCNAEAKASVILDERSAGFYALGLSRARSLPVALICTSGTAGAHYYPAIIEASLSGVALIVITCDRPYELHYTGTNQTIEQHNMFGNFVGCSRSIVAASSSNDLGYVLSTVEQVARVALAGKPVHLNVQFRAPLLQRQPDLILPDRIANWLTQDVRSQSVDNRIGGEERLVDLGIVKALGAAQKGLIVVGPIDTMAEQQALRQFIELANWPCVAERASGLTAHSPKVLPLLPEFECSDSFVPDCIIHFGRLPTMASTLSFLTTFKNGVCIQCNPEGATHDPTGFVTHQLSIGMADAVRGLVPLLRNSDLWDVFKRLQYSFDHVATVSSACDGSICDEDVFLNEINVIQEIFSVLRYFSRLYVGNSLPIRLINLVYGADVNVEVGAHRGASGIDGTLAIVAGWTAYSTQPAIVVIGDLSFYHDQVSLGLLGQFSHGAPCVIVVINNGGGRIFDTLSFLQDVPNYEALFLTPQVTTIAAIASTHKVAYTCADSVQSLRKQLACAIESRETTVLEAIVRGDLTAKMIESFMCEYLDKYEQ